MDSKSFLSLQDTYLHILDLLVEHCGDHWEWLLKKYLEATKSKIDTELNSRMEVL
jgi:hypothetical protein